MHAGHNFDLREVLFWTRRDLYKLAIVASIPTVAYQAAGWTFLAIPWLPIALVGTAVAFITGFKNNASYNRLWEARQTWGAIVNTSRAWGAMVLDFVTDDAGRSAELAVAHRRLVYRHIAWLDALRFQLREPRAWEHMRRAANKEYRKKYKVEEQEGSVEPVLERTLSPEEHAYVVARKNRATHLLALQSKDLRELNERGWLDGLRQIELERLIGQLYDAQGRCERTKNFPYPRQFATLNLFFVWIFLLLMPFGMLQEFQKLGGRAVWLTIPFSTLVSWIFLTIEKIGEASENPFEGSANDVPITAMSRTIEIELREMLGETDVPPAIQPTNLILM